MLGVDVHRADCIANTKKAHDPPLLSEDQVNYIILSMSEKQVFCMRTPAADVVARMDVTMQ